MDCRILRQIMLKADGHLVCDDSSGYFINLGEVSAAKSWSIGQVLGGAIYNHVRRSFAGGQVPWPGICETCDLFSRSIAPHDTLNHRIRIMIEPTLACGLACPTCKRRLEAGRRAGNWTLDPALLESLLASCARERIEVEEINYLGWGEPLLHPDFHKLTQIARTLAPHAVQEVTTTGNIVFHSGLENTELDRMVVSCDGVRQESYAAFRRNGFLPDVWQFMRTARARMSTRTFIEWKYILFEHNDSDEDLLHAQHLADEFGIDSLLFIITNSKWHSKRFGIHNINEFPLKSPITSVMPAAALQKLAFQGQIVENESLLGHQAVASLFVDSCSVTESQIMIIEGWALASDLSFVDYLELRRGVAEPIRLKPALRRMDVPATFPGAAGPDCGFSLRVPVDAAPTCETLDFLAVCAKGTQEFRAVICFHQMDLPSPRMEVGSLV
jgi:hypothetical protein